VGGFGAAASKGFVILTGGNAGSVPSWIAASGEAWWKGLDAAWRWWRCGFASKGFRGCESTAIAPLAPSDGSSKGFREAEGISNGFMGGAEKGELGT